MKGKAEKGLNLKIALMQIICGVLAGLIVDVIVKLSFNETMHIGTVVAIIVTMVIGYFLYRRRK